MSLKEKLSEEIQNCGWELLVPHYERGALLLVSSELNLADVGVALANDDMESVTTWLTSGDLQKVSPEKKEQWDKKNLSEFAEFLIIQPYVLIKLL